MPQSSQNNNNHSINFRGKSTSNTWLIPQLTSSTKEENIPDNREFSIAKGKTTQILYSHTTKAKDIKEKQSPRLPSSLLLWSYRMSQIPKETEINLSSLAI